MLNYAALAFPIRLVAPLLSSLLAACTVIPVGELTAAQCGNRSDDDDDALIDCADPDCLVFNSCRDPGRFPVADSGLQTEQDAAVAPPPPPPTDAGSNPEDLVDGGTPTIDAAVPPCTVSSCAAEEQCINGDCVPTVEVTGATYQLSIDSAVVPQLGSFGVCLDICTVVELVVCPCQPDPYIVVTLSRGGKTTTVGVTDWVSNTTEPMWSADPFTVELRTGDELFFQAFEYDADGPDAEILRCKPDLGQIPTGSLVCGSTAGHIDATIAPLK